VYFLLFFIFFGELGYKSENILVITENMFSNKVYEEFCWSKSKMLYLPILDKYVGENFFRGEDHYYIKNGCYINRMIKGYGLSRIDIDELVGDICVWFCEALDTYVFDEVILDNFDVKLDAYVYTKLKGKLHNHLKWLQRRQKQIPEYKRHKWGKHQDDNLSMPNKTELLSKLKPAEKFVVDCFYYENLKIKEISQILNKSESTVKRIKSQALKKLSSTNPL